MSYFIRAFFDDKLTPNREQLFVVSDSRHIYCAGKKELLHYQKKELDPRTCGDRRIMLTRLIAVDVDTGVFYGEMHPRDLPLPLGSFLARAWAPKKDSLLHGIPAKLLLPSRIHTSPELMQEVLDVTRIVHTQIGYMEGGFGPATVAAREFERTVQSYGTGHSFYVNLAAAAVFSAKACENAQMTSQNKWEAMKPVEQSFIEAMDQRFAGPAGWRSDPFARFVLTSPELGASVLNPGAQRPL